MFTRRLLKSKIHRATVTHADLQYEGSITIAPELMRAADILPHEAVWVWNVTSGQRFETYVITGKAGSSSICVNGAAAHCVTPGDLIIIASFVQVPDEYASLWSPHVVFVDAWNAIRDIRPEQLPESIDG